MKMFGRIAVAWLIVAGIAAPWCLGAEKNLTEKEKIEGLIKHVEGLTNAAFVRNGRDYDAKTAGRFLRGKWRANEKQVKTAADFIEKAASVSSTSGKPYVIRFKAGPEVKCGDYLQQELKKLDPGMDK